MTTPTSANLYGIGVGTASTASSGVVPFVATFSPASTNVIGPNGPFRIGQAWINTATNQEFVLTSLSSAGGTVSATWVTSAPGAVATVSGANGVTAAPTSGNVIVSGVNATTAAVGVASFNPADFTVSGGGQVSLIGGAAITTINGDTGSVTGSTVNFITNDGANPNGTAKFSGSASTMTLKASDTFFNTAWGLNSYKSATLAPPGVNSFNTAFGTSSLLACVPSALPSGNENTAIGFGSLNSLTGVAGGNDNTGIGANALLSLTTGSQNTVVGSNALNSLSTGNTNIVIGSDAGAQYLSSESSNIAIGNFGSTGESNAIRIGVNGAGGGQQNKCFIAGITGSTPVGGNTPQVTVTDSTGNVSVVSSSTAGFVLTSNGASTPSFQPGGSVVNVTSVTTTPYVVTATDQFLAVNTFLAGGAVTVQLPNAPTTGRVFYIKDTPGFSATNNITITTVGGAVLIDGSTTKLMKNDFQSVNVIFDGSSYQIY